MSRDPSPELQTPLPDVGRTPSFDPEPAESVPTGFVPPSEVLGRYVVLHRLGTGGMGVVYAAYDPKLDRRVALKLLRKNSSNPGRRKRAQERLLAEARALARLTHPNVITVHDVAAIDGRVVVAMEHVDGDTLSSALMRGDLDQKRVLEIMRQAGEGLAAAHAAGLVHRDFKPENVMLARDGRVLVMDFGLARATEPDRSFAALDRGAIGDADAMPAPQPQPEAKAVGTPAYMAPEQHEGGAVDGRTDQFSFCVTLYEALYGHRPFSGERSGAIQAQIAAAHLPDPPPESRVPAWIRTVIARGLSEAPDDRFRSMRALLEALARDPNATRRRWLGRLGVASIAGVIGVAGIGVFAGDRDGAEVCGGAEERLVGVWDDERRRAVVERIEQLGIPYGESASGAVVGALDGQAKQWVRAHVDACEATKVRGEQSDELLDLRMQCLGRRLSELDAVAGVLEEADAAVVRAGRATVDRMVPIEICADGRGLRARVPPPDDPRVRVELGDVRDLIARAKANGDAGRPGRGAVLARRATGQAREIDYAPVLAEALAEQGRLAADSAEFEEAEAALREAVSVAAKARHDQTAAEAYVTLLRVVGTFHDEPGRLAELEHAAGAAVARAGEPDELVARLATASGAVALGRGRVEDAARQFALALEAGERAVGENHPSLARYHNNIAAAHAEAGEIDKASAAFDRALELQAEAAGPSHPAVATIMANLSAVLLQRGDTQEASALSRRAIDVWARAEDPYPNELGTAHNNIGYAELLDGDERQAESHFRQALVYWERLGPEHPNVGRALGNLGTALQRQERYAEALTVLTRAQEIAATTMDPDHSDLATILTDLGIVHLALDDAAAATEQLERAQEIRKKRAGMPGELPRLRFALARALGPERIAEAVELARTARAGLRALPAEHPARRMLDKLRELNHLQYRKELDPEIESRIAQYEMAFRLQSSAPEVTDLSQESASTFELYGPDSRKPGTFAANCLLARRLAERGVRFIQLYHQGWDHHGGLPNAIRNQCQETDQASAALIQDLKQRGLLDETLVIWGGEFGRTSYSQGVLTPTDYGRDHHPRCFTIWMAGGGIRPGHCYGQTDAYGYNLADTNGEPIYPTKHEFTPDTMHVHDLQATILHLLGVDHTRLTHTYQGRHFRITDVHGHVVEDVLA